MNRDGMATFLERLGHRVVRTKSCYWYDFQARFSLGFPHPQPVSPDAAELRGVFATMRCLGVRFPAPPDAQGRLSYALMVDDPTYDLDHLSANTRSKVRRGLKQCEIRRLEPDFVRAHGQTANLDTLQRMRFQKDVYEWDHYWQAVRATEGIEVWGALKEGKLLAYLVFVLVEGCAEVLVARSCTDGLRWYPNNALLFTVVQDLMSRSDIERILFGLESLESVYGVDQFKESMGFQRRPLRQRIVFHPLLEWFVKTSVLQQAVRSMARARPKNEFWRKVEGLLIFHGSLTDTRTESGEASHASIPTP